MKILLLALLLCSCAFNTTIRVPKEKNNKLTFVGNATAVSSVEDGKRIALDDVIHQALFYAGVDVSSLLYSDRVNQHGIILEQISLISNAILESVKIKKIKIINKRKVYTEKHGIFDAYDVRIYVEVDASKIRNLKEIADKFKTDTIIREYSVTKNYSIPENPLYKQLEENKVMLLYNDEDKYPNTVVTLPRGFRLESAFFALIFPGLGQYINQDYDKGSSYGMAVMTCFTFGYLGFSSCYTIGGIVWVISILDAYVYAENKYNGAKETAK